MMYLNAEHLEERIGGRLIVRLGSISYGKPIRDRAGAVMYESENDSRAT